MSARYADALASTRSPSAAEKVEGPVAVTIRGDRVEVTDFHEGSWRVIQAVEERAMVVSPLENPDGQGERLPLVVTRDGHGAVATMRAKLWPGVDVTLRRIDVDAETYARRVLLAGTYRDGTGLTYRFTEDGKLTIGSGAASPYRASLDTSEANCDYFVLGKDERVGFEWKNGKLLLYKTFEDPNGYPISCRKAPFAVLMTPR